MKANVKIKTGKRLMKGDKIELPVEVTYNYDTTVEFENLTHTFEADEPKTIILVQKLGKNASSVLSERHMELERILMDSKWSKQDSYDARSVREAKKAEKERAEKATKETIEKERARKKKLEEEKISSKQEETSEGETE